MASTSCSRRVAVCGFGNVLRADDGVGPVAVTCLKRASGGRAVTLIGQQPFPEWSATLATADVAYFVDASFDLQIDYFRVTPIDIRSTVLLPDPHSLGPAKILDLTASLYDRVPKAYLVEIAARDFGFGLRLSPCSRMAVSRVTRWLRARLSRRVCFAHRNHGPSVRRGSDFSHPRSTFPLSRKHSPAPAEQGGDQQSATG